MKKFCSLILAVAIALSFSSSVAFATSNSNGTFEFVPVSSTERINKYGDFWYEFDNSLISDYFSVTRSSITVTSITSTNTKTWFYIVLYKDSEKIGSLLCKDNGKEYSKTFDNLIVGETYHFIFSKFNYFNDDLVKGEGHITNISIR